MNLMRYNSSYKTKFPNFAVQNFDIMKNIVRNVFLGLTVILLSLSTSYSQLNKKLSDAIIAGDAAVASEFLDEGGSPNSTLDNGWNALTLAIKEGKSDIVKMLIEKGANVNRPNSVGSTPLIVAINADQIESVTFHWGPLCGKSE